MELTDITRWLASGREYAQGVKLYAALGPSRAYQRLFALPPTDYSRQVLGRELERLAAAPEVAPVVAPEVAPEQLALPPAPVVAPAATPTSEASPLQQDIRAQLRLVRDERSQLHAQLTTPRLRRTDRYQMALRILELTEQEQQLLSDQAHVQLHGRLPGPIPLAEEQDAGELRRRLANLLSRRTKLRQRPEKAEQLQAVQASIDLIRQKL